MSKKPFNLEKPLTRDSKAWKTSDWSAMDYEYQQYECTVKPKWKKNSKERRHQSHQTMKQYRD